MQSVKKSYSLKDEIPALLSDEMGFTCEEGEVVENVSTKYIIHMVAPDSTVPMYIYDTGIYVMLVNDQRFYGATIEEFKEDFEKVFNYFESADESALFESILNK